MKFDLHTHHDRCGHAQDKIRDYIEAAIAGGFKSSGSLTTPLILEAQKIRLNLHRYG